MQRTLLVATFLAYAFASAAHAQDQPNLVGLWRFEVIDSETNPRCGDVTTIGEMNVTKKITARAYRGQTQVLHQSDRCGTIGHDTSGFTLRIRDNKVSVDYDEEEGWADEALVLDGDTLTGKDTAGTEVKFVRAVAQEIGTGDIDMGALNEYLESLRDDYSAALRKEYGANMLQNLRKTGLSREEAMEVAVTTIDRMTDCVLDIVRKDVVAMGISLEELKTNRSRYQMLQPDRVDYRNIECVYDTATNAGVVIH